MIEPRPGDRGWEGRIAEEYRSAAAAAEAADPSLAGEMKAWLDADLGDALPDED